MRQPKRDSLTEFKSVYHFDKATHKLHVTRSEDIEPLLEENTYARNHQGNNGFGKSRNWRKIGSIPMIIVEKMLREHGVNILDGSPEAEKYVKKFLNNNRAFRTVDKI